LGAAVESWPKPWLAALTEGHNGFQKKKYPALTALRKYDFLGAKLIFFRAHETLFFI